MPKTIKQIADELGVSKTAVRKEIARQGLQVIRNPSKVSENQGQVIGNQLEIDEETETLIREAFWERRNRKPNRKVSENLSEVSENQDKVSENQVQVSGNQPDRKSEVALEMLEVVREQLRAQDRQLREQADQIKQLNERLAETTAALVSAQQTIQAVQQTAQAAQALHAGTIQQQLAGQAASDPAAEQERTLSFWQRLFKR